MAVTTNFAVFRFVTSCSVAEVCHCYKGFCCLPVYMVPNPGRQ